MVEIFNDSVNFHERYFNTEKAVQQFRKDLHFESSTIRDVAKHSAIMEVKPTLPALTIFLGTNKTSCWAKFSPPTNYYTQRKRSLYIIPSLGGPDNQEIEIQKIKSFLDLLSEKKRYSELREFSDQDDNEQNQKDKNSSKEETNEQKAVEELQHNSRQLKLINQGFVLIKLIDEGIKSSNIMIDYIISRIFQFVQG